MTVNEILAIAEFFGDDMTESHVDRLMDECRQLSIVDRERLYSAPECIGCRKFYTSLSENSYELGWRSL